MQIIITGIHQRTTPVALRERIAFDVTQRAAALANLRPQVAEAWLLSTCNRVEICALVDDAADPAFLTQFLATWHHLDVADLAPHLYHYSNAEAVRHLFRLAAGLDSMVLGEQQILGQIKDAIHAAEAAGTLGPNLHRLTESALAAGKLVRTETGIARLNLSVVSVAIDLARQTSGALADQHILILGAGHMAELTLKHLHGVASKITILSRTPARAATLAARYGVASAPLADLAAHVATSDVVFSCTSSAEIVITAAQVAHAVAQRTHPLVLLDVAVPRDIEPAVAALPHVVLFDVDGMQAICTANRTTRAAEVDAAEIVVGGEVNKFLAWWTSQRIVPTIRALREHAETIRAAELERTLARLSHLGPNEQAAIGALSAAIVNKLLHQPISALKNPEHGDEMSRALHMLFQL